MVNIGTILLDHFLKLPWPSKVLFGQTCVWCSVMDMTWDVKDIFYEWAM